MTTVVTTITPDLLTVPEIAAYLSISERGVRDLVHCHAIPVIKIGQRIRVRRTDLDAYLAAHTREAVTR
ncbi:helix-turn-helix domain-containing protein [Microbacterium sp.]|uniref:helix-turn-helix domain-containing protein n=1 Tax=Microbacterium sp. TaxID=51671 RepID=UPI003C777798